ncbi:formimidoylglutamase [Sporomusa acidovorans]|uniref:Formimidoylglutamase n=1 Tax=Sporomusa acidovorans (strain ATCC 49682 / DSM 3132 / Mol) TaxID=1123286 RepID=A0ABZ3J9D6_SPOA4|nr:formimidoylglutamase [Sporomusa acidovorans]OZC16078.1 formimidoylglutamase [Sporomusa acidovorans DSM 3132]SDD87430.1 formiminoglutamase [Sporomusa acidovorans]
MLNNRYVPADMSVWRGRIDSEDNYDAFRWHQWIRAINLNSPDRLPVAGKLGFVLLGFCCDEGIRRNYGRTGAAKGPDAIRRELANLPCNFSQEVLLFDGGNILCPDEDLEASQAALANAVARVRELGLFSLVLGGGHELALGHYRGHRKYLADSKQLPEIGIVNFDAHFDIRPFAHGSSSGTMFRQIAQETIAAGQKFHYLCMGIQRYSNTLELFKTAARYGVVYIPAEEINVKGDWNVIEKLDEFMKATKNIYITVCADVFSTAFAPGVSAAQPLGLNPEDVLKYLKHILRSEKVIGFDIAEVSPRFDQDSTTASLAKVLIFSVVNTLCKLQGLDRRLF